MCEFILYQLIAHLLCQCSKLIYLTSRTTRSIKFRLEPIYCNRIYYIGWKNKFQMVAFLLGKKFSHMSLAIWYAYNYTFPCIPPSYSHSNPSPLLLCPIQVSTQTIPPQSSNFDLINFYKLSIE